MKFSREQFSKAFLERLCSKDKQLLEVFYRVIDLVMDSERFLNKSLEETLEEVFDMDILEFYK